MDLMDQKLRTSAERHLKQRRADDSSETNMVTNRTLQKQTCRQRVTTWGTAKGRPYRGIPAQVQNKNTVTQIVANTQKGQQWANSQGKMVVLNVGAPGPLQEIGVVVSTSLSGMDLLRSVSCDSVDENSCVPRILPGLPPARPSGVSNRLIPGADPVARAPFDLGPIRNEGNIRTNFKGFLTRAS
ncbi:hypothetical protein Tco_1122198 [Tanacetum coccineum]|uniref:Uncharacterized protein n=1 Tax=Tanacetum coccineum TaxID=301880 RepID=A0ABQ5IZV6_9ASTR